MNPADAGNLRVRLEPIVRRAGEHLLASFERLEGEPIERKGAVDLVTRLDREAQVRVVEGLEAAFPGEAILAEEGGEPGKLGAGRLWLVDPLDGTTNFVHGLPLFAVSVARVTDGEIDAGIVYAPYMRELFWAAAGQGAWLGVRALAVSRRTHLDDAVLVTGFPYDVRTHPRNNLREWSHLAVRCRALRRLGSAAIDLAYVAAGRVDGYWEYRLKPWDLAAGVLLVREAGGRVTDPQGGPRVLESGDVVATNGRMHVELLAGLGAAGA